VFVPGKPSVKVQPEITDIILGELYVVYVNVVNVTWTNLDSLAFIHLLTSFGLGLCWFAVSVKQ
jgi:hypothetical protein